MCELKVILEEKIVFKDAIYAKSDGNMVIVRDILRVTKEFEKCKIAEVNMNNTHLVLSPDRLIMKKEDGASKLLCSVL